MKILGIDPGLRALGWGIVDASQKALRWGTIRTNGVASLPQQLLFIERELLSIVESERPDAAVMEAVVIHKNPKSALVIGAARAVVLLTLAHQEIPVIEISPTNLKKAVTGSGRARKCQVGYMVRQLLDLEGEVSSHASDALACALVGVWREKELRGGVLNALRSDRPTG